MVRIHNFVARLRVRLALRLLPMVARCFELKLASKPYQAMFLYYTRILPLKLMLVALIREDSRTF